jgi:RNA polymerase sigma-54 factor
MTFRAALKPGQKVSIHPQAVVFQRLLSLPLCDLSREIQRETEENPALELAGEWRESDGEQARRFDDGGRTLRDVAADGDDIEAMAARTTLSQYLWESLALEVSDSLTRRIAYYLIHNLDDDGYLCCDLDEVARQFGTDNQTVERMLRLVQQLDPSGVGARNLQECLLIQTGRLNDYDVSHRAEAILREHWEAFGRRRFDLIARSMGISVRQVQEAAEFVRARLAPYPGRAYRLSWQRPPTLSGRLTADVIVRKNNGRVAVELAEGAGSRLRLNPSYLDVYAHMRTDGVSYAQEQRRHVADRLRRARLFLEALAQRRKTLKRIAGLIVSLERRFFEQGIEGHVLLSRRALARVLGVSPSTVSRALAHKHLLTPGGQLMPFDIFFDRSVAAKQIIRVLVAREAKGKPFSDADIARQLARHGLHWARRTIAKYREEMGILSRSRRSRKG